MASIGELDLEEDNKDEQIAPLLPESRINIFSVSYTRRTPIQGHVNETVDVSPSKQFVRWAWSGSTYSGLITMALSSLIYCSMELITQFFTGRYPFKFDIQYSILLIANPSDLTVEAIPLFEIALSRCIVISTLSILWLRSNGHPLFAPPNSTNILLFRAISGLISLLTFIYSTQMLPQSQAILVSFSAPIMASIAATCILQEKLKIAEIGGLVCSFFGVILIFWAMQRTPERMTKAGEGGLYVQKSNHTIAIAIGLVSSIAAGISYCLVRAGAKATDQPVLTVFSFSILAGPASALCTFVLQDFVFPSVYSLFLMIVLGILAFMAETTLARGLQLEKTSNVANIQYLEVAFSQILSMCSSKVVPSFARIVGCLLILISASCTMYLGPGKEDE